LIITGEEPSPFEVNPGGTVINRRDMETHHEEADVIIIQQLLLIDAENHNHSVCIVCDDTDVFVLLLHYYVLKDLHLPVVMQSPVKGRAVIDIRKTVAVHHKIIPELLAAHALSGCETVASCFGIGKGTVLKKLRSGLSLSYIGNTDIPLK